MAVAGGDEDLEGLAFDFKEAEVEGAAAEVVDGDELIFLAGEAICHGGGGGLVKQAHDLKAGELGGFHRGLALEIIEVSGDGDDGAGNGLAEVSFGRFAQFHQDERGEFLGKVFAIADADHDAAIGGIFVDFEGVFLFVFADFLSEAADEALGGGDGALRLRGSLTTGDLADDDVAVFHEGDDRRGLGLTFGIENDARLAPFDHGDDGIGRAEIDADDVSHAIHKSLLRMPRRAAGVK